MPVIQSVIQSSKISHASLFVNNLLLLGFDPNGIRFGSDMFAVRNENGLFHILYFLLTLHSDVYKEALKYSWPVTIDSKTEFKKKVQEILFELEKEKHLPYGSSHASRLNSSSGQRTIELVWNLSSFLLKSTFHKTYGQSCSFGLPRKTKPMKTKPTVTKVPSNRNKNPTTEMKSTECNVTKCKLSECNLTKCKSTECKWTLNYLSHQKTKEEKQVYLQCHLIQERRQFEMLCFKINQAQEKWKEYAKQITRKIRQLQSKEQDAVVVENKDMQVLELKDVVHLKVVQKDDSILLNEESHLARLASMEKIKSCWKDIEQYISKKNTTLMNTMVERLKSNEEHYVLEGSVLKNQLPVCSKDMELNLKDMIKNWKIYLENSLCANLKNYENDQIPSLEKKLKDVETQSSQLATVLENLVLNLETCIQHLQHPSTSINIHQHPQQHQNCQKVTSTTEQLFNDAPSSLLPPTPPLNYLPDEMELIESMDKLESFFVQYSSEASSFNSQ